MIILWYQTTLPWAEGSHLAHIHVPFPKAAECNDGLKQGPWKPGPLVLTQGNWEESHHFHSSLPSAEVFLVTLLWSLLFIMISFMMTSLSRPTFIPQPMCCPTKHFSINFLYASPPWKLDMKQVAQNKHLHLTHVISSKTLLPLINQENCTLLELLLLR